MFEKVRKNEFGFYQIKDIPSKNDLQEYYSNKYYQDELQYDHKYSEKEKSYITNKIAQKHETIKGLMDAQSHKLRLLDVGCGEGWTLKYFNEQENWEVTGVDFSDFGVRNHNPGLADVVLKGDLETSLESLIQKGEKYDLIWMDNVLEHVIDPENVLKVCHQLGTGKSILLVEVPNDFSKLQELLVETKRISNPFWVVPPDHLSYFSIEGLNNVSESAGWKTRGNVSDFPIDWFLLNNLTNYVENSALGKSCHLARVELENFIHAQGVSKANRFYEALADLGMGREIVGYYSKE